MDSAAMESLPLSSTQPEQTQESSVSGAASSTAQKKLRRRCDRGKKGASPMWINAQIIACSQHGGGLSELLSTVATHMPKMNLVNLTTAIHRLGKVVSHDPRLQPQLKSCQVFKDILATITRVLTNCNPNDVQPQSLSNILWALASSRHSDVQIIHLACDRALPNIARFKSFELSTALWAITKLSTIDGRVKFDSPPIGLIFKEASKHVIEHASSMEFRCLSMIVWSYATARQVDYSLFARIALQMTATAHTATCQEMGNAVWAFGTLNLAEHELFGALARKGMTELNQFKPQELSNMLWGFASSGFFHEVFFQKAAVAAKSKELSAQHLANILWAFSRVRPRHPLTQRTILSLLPLCCRFSETFKAQELSSVALSVAKAFSGGDGEAQLPAEVVLFFECIPRAVPSDLSCFSTQSLTNMAAAFAMVGICQSDGLFPALGREAITRVHTLQATQLLRLFQVFLTATSDGSCADVAGLLALTLADRVEGLRARGVRSLSRSCSEYFGFTRSRDLNRRELRALCIQVGQKVSCSNADPKKLVAHLNFEDFEVDGTEATVEPSVTISELSDPIGESLPDGRHDRTQTDVKNQMWTSSHKENLRRSFFTSLGEDDVSTPLQPMGMASRSHGSQSQSSQMMGMRAPPTISSPSLVTLDLHSTISHDLQSGMSNAESEGYDELQSIASSTGMLSGARPSSYAHAMNSPVFQHGNQMDRNKFEPQPRMHRGVQHSSDSDRLAEVARDARPQLSPQFCNTLLTKLLGPDANLLQSYSQRDEPPVPPRGGFSASSDPGYQQNAYVPRVAFQQQEDFNCQRSQAMRSPQWPSAPSIEAGRQPNFRHGPSSDPGYGREVPLRNIQDPSFLAQPPLDLKAPKMGQTVQMFNHLGQPSYNMGVPEAAPYRRFQEFNCQDVPLDTTTNNLQNSSYSCRIAGQQAPFDMQLTQVPEMGPGSQVPQRSANLQSWWLNQLRSPATGPTEQEDDTRSPGPLHACARPAPLPADEDEDFDYNTDDGF